MKPIVELESVSKKYLVGRHAAPYATLRDTIAALAAPAPQRDFWALRDISFTLEPGETMGVIGENGAGKTTLLKILSKITRPTSGRGRIRGRVASLLEVGTGFHHELTGRENIYLNGVILGMKKKEIDRRLDAIVDYACVGEFLSTPLKHYSSGMWARLAFSVAAHLDPDILLIDEVLSVGDAEFQRKSLATMDDLSRSGRTVIFVSHNMAAVRRLCSRCMLISRGKLRAIGEAAGVIDAYMAACCRRTGGSADLTERRDRKGSQKVRLERIELRNQHGKVAQRFLIRDDLSIHLFFKACGPVRNVKIIVEILEAAGQPVCNIYDSDSGFGLTNVLGPAHISLTLKDLRFYPGTYHVSVSLMSEILHYRADCYDEIACAVSFDMANQFIMDRALSRRSGLLLLTPEWQVHDTADTAAGAPCPAAENP